MQVYVGDFLSSTASIVQHQVEAFGFENPHLRDGDFASGFHDSGMEFCGQCGDAVVVIFWDDQGMSIIKRGNIEKGQNLVIFVQFAARNFTADDFTENAIFNQWHGTLLSSFYGRKLTKGHERRQHYNVMCFFVRAREDREKDVV